MEKESVKKNIQRLKNIVSLGASFQEWVNERGNAVTSSHIGSVDRYKFDFEICTPSLGFEQFDTDQDAHYFGVWVNAEERVTVTYAEGDLTLVACASLEGFKAEIADAEECYGSAPPMAIGIDVDTGTVTKFYDDRISAENL